MKQVNRGVDMPHLFFFSLFLQLGDNETETLAEGNLQNSSPDLISHQPCPGLKKNLENRIETKCQNGNGRKGEAKKGGGQTTGIMSTLSETRQNEVIIRDMSNFTVSFCICICICIPLCKSIETFFRPRLLARENIASSPVEDFTTLPICRMHNLHGLAWKYHTTVTARWGPDVSGWVCEPRRQHGEVALEFIGHWLWRGS